MFLLYAILLITIDVGFIIVTRHDEKSRMLVNKTQQQLKETIRLALETEHVLQASYQERSTFKESAKMQNSSQKEEALKGQ